MKTSWTDRITLFAMIIIAAYGINEVLGYLIPGSLEASVTMLIIETAFVLIAVAAWRGRLPWLNIVIAGFSFVLGNTTNYAETTHYNWGFWVQMGVAAVSAICGTVLMLRKKEKHKAVPARELILCALICACALAVWGGWTMKDKKATGIARHTMWAVPTELDSAPCENAGTLEEIIYETKAYGTDSRTLNKRALVYLPYGYDESEKYNILYLMHGTGDDENYWLSTHETNKTMLDNMIARGDIEPLIIVTPTFYVEDDLKDTGLDPLTYSFREELRNDLMPAVESKYSTWAETADAEGFAASRDHRAFAGLSRGAVTTYHSAFCGSLDWFSWFGTFSGSRTDQAYFQQTIQSEEFRELPIHYLYVSSGVFDFALPRQLQDTDGLLSIEPRLTTGVNTDFDVFPMRYHSIGNWHLALYNFLQRIF